MFSINDTHNKSFFILFKVSFLSQLSPTNSVISWLFLLLWINSSADAYLVMLFCELIIEVLSSQVEISLSAEPISFHSSLLKSNFLIRSESNDLKA
jgi:hypothetical protein